MKSAHVGLPRPRRATLVVAVAAAAAVFLCSGAARGNPINGGTLSQKVLQIHVAADGENLLYELDFDPGSLIDGKYTCVAPADLELKANGKLLLTLHSLCVEYFTDPAVVVGFYATAGGTDTTLTFTSGIVTFDPLTDPQAYATAAVTVTDNTGDGATLTGQFTGSKAYQALFNSGPSVFAELIGVTTASANASAASVDYKPAVGWETITGAVSSIQSQFQFVLTANDSASGTSRFEVVPEPATTGLVGLGLLLVFTVRRKR